MIECYIIDRDLESRNQLRVLLSQYPFIHVGAAYESNAAASQFSLSEVHAIFSDSPRDELFKSVAPNVVELAPAPPPPPHTQGQGGRSSLFCCDRRGWGIGPCRIEK